MFPMASRRRRRVDARLVDLLHVVSSELETVANDIVQLGESIAEDRERAGSADLQAFDLIGQNALAQARLLGELGRRLATSGNGDVRSLLSLVEAVPFHAVRLRLRAALRGEPLIERAATEPIDEAEWF